MPQYKIYDPGFVHSCLAFYTNKAKLSRNIRTDLILLQKEWRWLKISRMNGIIINNESGVRKKRDKVKTIYSP